MENLISVFFIFLLIILLTMAAWEKRHLYYYGFKIPGPFTIPIIGRLRFLLREREDFFRGVLKTIKSNRPVFKEWLGSKLVIANSNPEDVEIILNNFFTKGWAYQVVAEFVSNSIFCAPVDIWKKKRRIINHSFQAQVINSYFDIFNRNSKAFVEDLKRNSGEIENNLFFKIWVNTLLSAAEALLDVNPKNSFLENFLIHKYIYSATRLEQIVLTRIHKIWLMIEFLWKLSSLRKEAEKIITECNEVINKVLEFKLAERKLNNDAIRRKRFLNHLIDNQQFSKSDLLPEINFMCMAGSETTASAITFVLLALGIYQDIQDKVFQEITSTFENPENRDLTLQLLNKMEYLERVIKETLRIKPTVPLILRKIDQTIKIGSYVYPAGSEVVIPIEHIHNRPDLWSNPSKFDPDRFLPEEIEKRHRCSFLPFSVGSRNCIGLYYGMLSIKILVVNIVRNFKIKTLDYKSLEDVETEYQLVSKPKVYRVLFEKRL